MSSHYANGLFRIEHGEEPWQRLFSCICAVSGVDYIFSRGFASPACGLALPMRSAREENSGTHGISLTVSNKKLTSVNIEKNNF